MAWLKIESSVARNKKFVKAGPAPSWLWVCGLAYCQEGLTDGFIPREALPYLGVKNAAQLADHLVKAGLWHEAEGGWHVNDYLEHNRSAEQIAGIKASRANGGKHGGRPRAKPLQHTEGFTSDTPKVSPSETLDVAVAGAVSFLTKEEIEKAAPFDGQVAFARLTGAYPQNRIATGQRTQAAFIDAVFSEGRPRETFDRMLANLENHKRSHEWRIKGMVPGIDKWLRDGLWQRTMDEAPPVADQLSRKTNVTMQAAATVLRKESA